MIQVKKAIRLNVSKSPKPSAQLKKKCTHSLYCNSNQKASSVIQLDHSFYKVHGEVENLKVITFIETVTSMSGAVMVPDLSANQVTIKALKKFVAVNGSTKSVLQCDGHSGLLALQEQVGCDMSLPTQISPPYSHQSQGTVDRLRKTLYGQVRAMRIGLADQLGLHSEHVEGSLLPWIVQRTCNLSDQPLSRQIRWKIRYCKSYQPLKNHSGFGRQ